MSIDKPCNTCGGSGVVRREIGAGFSALEGCRDCEAGKAFARARWEDAAAELRLAMKNRAES